MGASAGADIGALGSSGKGAAGATTALTGVASPGAAALLQAASARTPRAVVNRSVVLWVREFRFMVIQPFRDAAVPGAFGLFDRRRVNGA